MITRTKATWSAMTLLGLLAGSALADEAAVVRISDKATPTPNAGPVAMTAPMPMNGGGAVIGGAPGDAMCDGNCDGNCRGHHCCLTGGNCYSPTAGFRPIDFSPINRDAVVYWHYWPAKWYGQPGWQLKPTYPMVYMPTDTTQLGFYYQRVPQWQPNSAMYPAAPNPSLWHRRVVYGMGAGGMGGAGCYPDGGSMTAVGNGSIINTASGPTSVMASPAAQPQAPSQPPTSQPGAAPPPSPGASAGTDDPAAPSSASTQPDSPN